MLRETSSEGCLVRGPNYASPSQNNSQTKRSRVVVIELRNQPAMDFGSSFNV